MDRLFGFAPSATVYSEMNPILTYLRAAYHLGQKGLLALCALLFMTGAAWAETPAAEHATEHHEEALPQGAPLLVDTVIHNVPLIHDLPIKVNNSMVITWVVMLALIISAQVAMRKVKDVPDGAQNFWEWVVESLYTFLEGIIGKQLVKKTFWFFATIFIFILTLNWFSLIPGVGTIGWGIPDPYSGVVTHITRPILRGPNADLNMTMAMALTFFFFWIVWALQANGFGGFILHLFGPKGDAKGFMKVLMVIVFICVGFLEIVSILFRPVSLSFRLYGNIFAGENTIETMAALGGPYFGWLLPLPFYFLEILVGLVQAMVFMLLTAVFTLLIMPEEGHGHH
jgi:F-type H+-transporting ATPase subunit a